MKEKEKWWLAFFLMLPFFGAKILADSLAESEDMKLLYSVMFGGFGVLVGYGLYSFTKDKATIAKLVTLGAIVAVFAVTTIALSSSQADITSNTNQAKQVDKPVKTIAKDNTDLASIENIARPSKSKIVSPSFSLDKLLGVWTYDPDGPHADFDLNKDWFYVVDYDGNGEMPYVINKDSITVFYNDYITKGRIEKATGDSLVIAWDGQPAVISVRWKN